MIALECALTWNPNPLQEFAALKDFSGECISFLTHLTSWRKIWLKQGCNAQRLSTCIQPHPPQRKPLSEELLRETYNCAISLYAVFVSQEHAEFPINLSSRTLRCLDTMFARPANLLFGDSSSQETVNSATPFADDRSKSVTMMDVEEIRDDGASTGVLRLHGVYYWGNIPEDFSPECFDDAEREIKYLVLTNTWPKFVNAGYAERIRDSQGRPLGRRLAQHFFRKHTDA